MIKAIIFDCFGVLYTETKAQIMELCPPERRTELTDLYTQVDYGYITTANFFEQVAVLIGKTAAEVAALTQQQHLRNEPLIARAQQLKAQYKIGLLSNVGDDFIAYLFTPQEITNLFDDMVLSSSVGITKPSPQIYELAAARLGVEPEECVFIDDREINVDGANRVDMNGVLFTTNSQLENDLAPFLKEV